MSEFHPHSLGNGHHYAREVSGVASSTWIVTVQVLPLSHAPPAYKPHSAMCSPVMEPSYTMSLLSSSVPS